ncbi:MgtC/SapB family protein [Chromobacterium haemolyticum]|nr:MgtC/SapB family protein [Chromobacterium haemolyticum]
MLPSTPLGSHAAEWLPAKTAVALATATCYRRRTSLSANGACMDISFAELISRYWSTPKWEINLLITLNLLGGLLLGCLVGYERWFNGRAAGMRTYGLVSMASAAAISIVGYSGYWYGGLYPDMPHGDMTRVAQGVLTGVGFLGAGMIMKEGLSISGLTSAASIWMSSVIGILVGVGFYAAAIAITLLCCAVHALHQSDGKPAAAPLQPVHRHPLQAGIPVDGANAERWPASLRRASARGQHCAECRPGRHRMELSGLCAKPAGPGQCRGPVARDHADRPYRNPEYPARSQLKPLT